MIALNAGDQAQALRFLDEAVDADPDDADVRYQRGVVRARSGDTNGAIEDLQHALALRPYFPNAALELGIALVDGDRAVEAEAPLLQAQLVPALDAQASFYLALAQLRIGRFETAQTNLERARKADPSLATAADYYEGVIAFRRRAYDDAEVKFAAVQRERPDSPMGRESEQYLAVIAGERAADYSAFGTMALEYDTNVTLGPSQTVPGSVSGQGDGRYVINGGARWTPVHWGGASLSVSYEFFQSLQFHLTSFNLQDNRPAVQLQYDLDWLSFGLLGRYDYYLLDSGSYLSEFTAMPWVTAREEGFGRTEVYARIQPRDFKKRAYNVLNGIYSFAGARQFFDIGNAAQQVWVGYQLGNTSPQSSDSATTEFLRNQYQYGSWAAEAGIRWPLPLDILGELAYRYEHQSYGAASGCFANSDSSPAPPCDPLSPLPSGLTRRADNDHRVILSLERPLPELWDHLSVVAAYFGTFNDSNKSVFTYDRNIGSIGLTVRY
ncbi:MAG TPA: tetratricopeptide repeat protein [Candidatus Dormibacteraeota bacterium]|nr:tetratricopeptide repeat protein [Candidatus Dormibacteraeota bacterium]